MFLSPLRLDFIYDLFEKVGSRNNEEKMGTARRKPTVSSQFRVSDGGSLRCLDTQLELKGVKVSVTGSSENS